MPNMNDIPSPMTHSSQSRASDTSSAYSGSDVMQSSTNGEDYLLSNSGENCLGANDDGGVSRCMSVHETDDESETSSEVSFRSVNVSISVDFFFVLAFISYP